MPEAPHRHVFVYGTLRRGGRNDINGLAPAPEYVGMGEVRGVMAGSCAGRRSQCSMARPPMPKRSQASRKTGIAAAIGLDSAT